MFASNYYPSIPENWIYKCEPRHIPASAAIYVIVAYNGAVKYVGQTTNLQQRYKDHGSLICGSDKFGWILCEKDELLFLECWFIATLRPKLNGNSNKRARSCQLSNPSLLKVKARNVWSIGQPAVAYKSSLKNSYAGVIEKFGSGLFYKNSVLLSGRWFDKMYITITL